MQVLISISPVLLFLVFLFLLDSFKLVLKKLLFFSVLWGIFSALFAYLANTYVIEKVNLPFEIVSNYWAPAIEEIIKSLLIFFLIYKKRVGFMIDAAIYGFAIGAGFALVENLFYLQSANDPNLMIWIIRGFGTAIMHGGCTALLAIIIVGGKVRNTAMYFHVPLAIVVAYIIHSGFNHFYIEPIFQALGIIIILPLVFILIFRNNEKQLQNWLEIEFNSEVELLSSIDKGQFLTTRAGEYMEIVKSKFSGEIILDMYCYLRLYLELSIKAKRNVMLKENGFPVIIEEDMPSKLKEFSQLRKQIGKLGELTLSPLIRMNYRDLWKLNSLK